MWAYILESLPNKKYLAATVETQAKERCPLRGPFFALTYKYIENVTYEEIFYLVKEGNFSFTEAYSLPIRLRAWFVNRLISYLTPEQ